jgi:hypothetical protein
MTVRFPSLTSGAMRVRLTILSLSALSLGAWLLDAVPASAHRSNSAFYVEKIIELKGVITKWEWINPHTFISLSVDDGKGAKVEWTVEGRAPGVLRRAGWERTTLQVGETLTVHCSPAKDNSRVCLAARVTKADGTILSNGG